MLHLDHAYQNTFEDNSEDLDIVMPMFNLLEYSNNLYMASRSLWNCDDENKNDNAQQNNHNYIF